MAQRAAAHLGRGWWGIPKTASWRAISGEKKCCGEAVSKRSPSRFAFGASSVTAWHCAARLSAGCAPV
eukprot:1472004-Pyramimonas_sp.AAC.1